MAIDGDDFFWPQQPATPVGEEGVTKREALVFFLANGFMSSQGEGVLRSNLDQEAIDLIATKIWTIANTIMAADPTP